MPNTHHYMALVWDKNSLDALGLYFAYTGVQYDILLLVW